MFLGVAELRGRTLLLVVELLRGAVKLLSRAAALIAQLWRRLLLGILQLCCCLLLGIIERRCSALLGILERRSRALRRNHFRPAAGGRGRVARSTARLCPEVVARN